MDFAKHESVAKCSVLRGLFSSSKYVHDKSEFIERCLSAWYNFPGNTIPLPTERHEDFAESLFDFYVALREFVDAYPVSSKLKGRILKEISDNSFEDAKMIFAEIKHAFVPTSRNPSEG